MSRPKLDQVERAQIGWGENMPAEIAALAAACKARSSRAVAQQLGYSDATISYVLANKYQNGDQPKLFDRIRAHLLGQTLTCPELREEISRTTCLKNQAKPFSAANSVSARLFHACKRCPNRQQKETA